MNLTELVPTIAEMHPERLALIDANRSESYAALVDFASRFANVLRARGIQPGDRVALLGAPTLDLAKVEVACLAAGAVPVSVFDSLAPPEVQSIVEDADPKAAVIGADVLEVSGNVSSASLELKISTTSGADFPAMDELAARASRLDPWHRPDLDDLALLIYTGGTTGRSKGVMHTHRSLMSWALMQPADGYGSGSRDVRVPIPNLAHIGGQFSLWTTLAIGGGAVMSGSGPLTADRMVDMIEEFRLAKVTLLGSLFRDVVTLKGIERRDLSSVKSVLHGAAPTSPGTIRRAVEVFSTAKVFEAYAQTESGLAITAINMTDLVERGCTASQLHTVGNTADVSVFEQESQRMRIVDESGRDVATGERGEVISCGPQMMSGYWRNPEVTAAAMRDGWLHTGDVGSIDEENNLYLADRIKDMVKVSASPVYTSEVEMAVSDHPAIRELTVLGMPLPEEGEELVAVATLQPGANLSLKDLRKHCEGKIATYKHPTRLEIVDALPKTPVHKVNKAELRARLSAAPVA